MSIWHYEAMTWDGDVYCVECLPEGVTIDDAQAIFVIDQWPNPGAPCGYCDKIHDYMSLTG